ncbi:hypothetical protein L6164_025900 [Bauhinia variegata]|uniref:Uncharacterized protein n=1 Tax=Bauhinia variegata TaxID=167791 RepID=A0ACB9M3J9_BAUVA|nr:hypothetical protein L6164_025900 [Bauhinia variegata]
MELSFAYNMFYSKDVVIDKLWCIASWLLRFISFFSIITAGILFVCVERHKPVKIDKAITITLLLKAVVLECGSFVVSLLSIDTLVMVAHRPGWIWKKLVSMNIACQNYLAPRTKVGQFNLLSYSSTDRKSWNFLKSLLEIFDFKEFIDNCRFNKYVSLDNNRITLRFDEVSTMRTNAPQVEELNHFCLIGDKIINELKEEITTDAVGQDNLTRFSRTSFEERLLIYHVATELYYDWQANQGNEIQPEEGNPSSPEQGNVSVEDKMFLKASKILSDYMLYLLVAHPSLLLPVLTPELRSYRDTRATTVRFFHDYCCQDEDNPYEAMRTNYTRFSGTTDGVKYRNSVVLDGIKVSNYVISRRKNDTGRLLCQLWLEMLCFAASQCNGQSHAKQLAVAPQEGQNNNEDSTTVTPQEGQNNNEDSTGVAPQEGQNNINEDLNQEQQRYTTLDTF